MKFQRILLLEKNISILNKPINTFGSDGFFNLRFMGNVGIKPKSCTRNFKFT